MITIKCSACNTEVNTDGRREAMEAGWRFVEMYGSGGNKYGVFCATETKAKILDTLREFLESLARGRK